MLIITIDREFGAGGHSIGRKVADRLGIEFYDKDIIREAARSGGIDADLITAEEERVSRMDAFIRAISPRSYDDKDVIFDHESRAIVTLARRQPCVILGRCATAVLREAGIGALSVFLHADEEARVPHAGELLGLTDHDAVVHAMRKRDIARRSYVASYTSSHWGDAKEYTLALDTGALGYDLCVDLICSAAKGAPHGGDR